LLNEPLENCPDDFSSNHLFAMNRSERTTAANDRSLAIAQKAVRLFGLVDGSFRHWPTVARPKRGRLDKNATITAPRFPQKSYLGKFGTTKEDRRGNSMKFADRQRSDEPRTPSLV
jgi:hypothetical protein